jgi:hypothetical protein
MAHALCFSLLAVFAIVFVRKYLKILLGKRMTIVHEWIVNYLGALKTP